MYLKQFIARNFSLTSQVSDASIGSSNGLALNGDKPFLEPMPTQIYDAMGQNEVLAFLKFRYDKYLQAISIKFMLHVK